MYYPCYRTGANGTASPRSWECCGVVLGEDRPQGFGVRALLNRLPHDPKLPVCTEDMGSQKVRCFKVFVEVCFSVITFLVAMPSTDSFMSKMAR
jgi:hypothetical protein